MILIAMIVLVPVVAHGQIQAMPVEKPLPPAPIVIAHRGASGERPEHTLAAYELAIDQGADVIEPDLVPTRDGVLVARHENDITDTTDVAAHPEFANRRATKVIDGETHDGWFTEDFTLAELNTLRAKERLPQLRPGNVAFDGRFAIPTLAEVIALAQRRGVGIYPETKHPTYFASIALPTDAALVAALHRAGWDDAGDPVFIQSFEVDNLKRLHGMTKLRLIQLVAAGGGPADGAADTYAEMMTPAGLAAIARYAWGIGPDKAMVADGALVRAAHRAGLRVHPWTYRAENIFLPRDFRHGDDPAAHGDVAGEIGSALAKGVDGFFTDFPAWGAKARNAARGAE